MRQHPRLIRAIGRSFPSLQESRIREILIAYRTRKSATVIPMVDIHFIHYIREQINTAIRTRHHR